MITDINSEDRLVQETFANYLHDKLGWESIYAYDQETFGAQGSLGRKDTREVVLVRYLRLAMQKLNPSLPEKAVEDAIQVLIKPDLSKSTLQHNELNYHYLRDGVPVTYRDANNNQQDGRAKVMDFRNPGNNRFLVVRELKIQGLQVPNYNRRADLVCFVNGLPLVFVELKAVYRNIRRAFEDNLSDYRDTIPHVFHHNAFLLVSNGDKAKYGSITAEWEHFAEWKRNDEREEGSVDAKKLLDGMLNKESLLDIVENFILFDSSKLGVTRKVVGRNHQVLGVNLALESVKRQEVLKKEYPIERRLAYKVPKESYAESGQLPLVERANKDLGRLGVFWHTQGSGKSYSMIFFAEKVRRTITGDFTFLVMTDRDDLDGQIYKTFIGCGVADPKTTPRASSGEELKRILAEDHRYIFSLIHKFNQDVTPETPYSKRDDIIVISDEAHRTQAGKLARNMRLALPNASFIGFTGTPLFKHDNLTERIFGPYVSRYDFKRSEMDGSTVKLVYENRGEKLGLCRLDLNDRIAEKIEEAELDPDQTALLEHLLGRDYEVITADDRLDKIADDFVEHYSTRWESGKTMFVCIDKITCGRMLQRIQPRWATKTLGVEAEAKAKEAKLAKERDDEKVAKLTKELETLRNKAKWMRETIIEMVISEGQNEVRDFEKWNFDIRPHRQVMKLGFETPDGGRIDTETAFKNPEHPFRVAVVCAMWLTGFDVECLASLYIDKPMRAHNLMQAIARANRIYPGKPFGVIVDYNGVTKALREALAQYALGDDDGGKVGAPPPGEPQPDVKDVVAPIEEMVARLEEAISVAEAHLAKLGFDSKRLTKAQGFDRIEALRDAVDALYESDEAKRRFEIMARQVFINAKALIMEPSAYRFAERHDNIEAIYKKLQERRDNSDVTEVLKALHRIINEAIATQGSGADSAEGMKIHMSKIDFGKLRAEFAKKTQHKPAVVQDLRQIIEDKLLKMLAQNPKRMDFYKRYQEIVADYNREKDRTTVEDTFAQLVELAGSLDEEQRRAVAEGLNEEELALFDLLQRSDITKAQREKLKLASRDLLASLQEQLKQMEDFRMNTATQATIEVLILDKVHAALPKPPYTEQDEEAIAKQIYDFVWQYEVA
jgi:type I restriction enzyme R subunit